MKLFRNFIFTFLGLAIIISSNGQGFLKKLKDKAEKAVSGSSTSTSTATPQGSSGSNGNNNGKSNTSNKGGEGLISTPPDVNENLNTAEQAYKNKNYGDARYSVQQAMLGVELQIGRKILKELPPEINGLKKDTINDQVTSTGWGWAGLTIQRMYKDKDVEFKLTIANNAAWMQAVNMYLSNAGYAQSNGDQQKFKQIRVKGYKAIIEFDKSSGYKISIPIGQTSLLMLEGINFSTEQQMMVATNLIDIYNIKATLGEK